MTWIVIRVRGGLHARGDILETLEFLHLTRPNHATVIPEAPSFRGMLYKVQGYVTWGEAEPETIGLLLKQRGERPPTDGGLTKATAKTGELGDLAGAVHQQGLLHVAGVRPMFRLKPPKGGWRSTKKSFVQGGALGYRGRAINALAQKMV